MDGDRSARDLIASRREHLMSEITYTPEPLLVRASRSRLRLAVAVLTVVLLTTGISVAATIGGGPSGQGPAAFAVERLPGGPVRIRVVDTAASAAQMTRQLHAQGLNISITTMPANAQLVGEWLTVSSSGGDFADQTRLGDQMSQDPTVIEIPPGLLHGWLSFGVARAAKPGEKLAVAGLRNALRPAGPLFCLKLVGSDPAAAASSLEAAGYHVRFEPRLGAFSTATTTPPPGVVVQAYLWDPIMGVPGSPKDIYVTVRDPASVNYPAFAWLGWPTSMRASGVRDYSGCKTP